jgi:hypothetical protein
VQQILAGGLHVVVSFPEKNEPTFSASGRWSINFVKLITTQMNQFNNSNKMQGNKK